MPTRSQLFALLAITFCIQAAPVRAVDWPGAVLVPYGEELDLEASEVYLLGYAYDGQDDVVLPYGSDAMDDPDSRANATPAVRSGTGLACYMHCPYRGGRGVAFQEFEIALPAAGEIGLEGATALRDGAEESDGVGYRILINGEIVFSEDRKSFQPERFLVDLAPYGGETIRLRFEVGPGPDGNTAFDWSMWLNRRIIIPGHVGSAPIPRAPLSLDLSRLTARQNGSWVPLSGFEAKHTVEMIAGVYVLRYDGHDGTLEYRWQPPTRESDPPLGTWRLVATTYHAERVTLPLATGARIAWDGVAKATAWRHGMEDGAPFAETEYEIGGTQATLRITPRLEEKSLVLEVTCDTPHIVQFYPGKWGPSPRRQQVPVPYYGHDVDYLPVENLFVSRFLDFSASNARDINRNIATYPKRIGGERNPLRERAIFTGAWHLAECYANIPNPPSPWREEMGGRIVLDIWGGRYRDIAETLASYKAMDLDGIAAIIHNWQFHGYDNGLPSHYPANPRYGGHDEMLALSETARDAGYYFALHENYVDYYPNYEHFDERHIALDENGGRIKAWYNASTEIQSYAVRPAAMLALARSQSPRIHENYNTNAMFHDVASCVEPWFHVDHRDDGPDAATMRPTVAAHTELFDFERKTHGGPVLGEGNRHWMWSGLLDGVEAQFGTGWPNNAGPDAPLNASFNLLRIHPLQLNHGQGYFSRWYGDAPWGGVLPPVMLDKYRMQEIVFGHAGFLNANWARPYEAWLEHELTIPVTRRHAMAEVVEIAYRIGGVWVDSTAAAKAQDFNVVRVAYDSGLRIAANGTEALLNIDEWQLPASGWIAEAEDFAAGTVLFDGVVADFVRAPGHFFVNARPASQWTTGGALPIHPKVEGFTQTAPGQFEATYVWNVGAPIEDDARVFVHFCDIADYDDRPAAIRFQNDHPLATPTSEWRAEQRIIDGPHRIAIPENLPDGRYLWEIGLLDLRGNRLSIDGFDDGSNRVRLGSVIVSGNGSTIRFEASAESKPRSFWSTQHVNTGARVLDFGAIRSNGSARLERRGGTWRLRPMPVDSSFVLEFRVADFPMPDRVITSDGTELQVTRNEAYWSLPLGGAQYFEWDARP